MCDGLVCHACSRSYDHEVVGGALSFAGFPEAENHCSFAGVWGFSGGGGLNGFDLVIDSIVTLLSLSWGCWARTHTLVQPQHKHTHKTYPSHTCDGCLLCVRMPRGDTSVCTVCMCVSSSYCRDQT